MKRDTLYGTAEVKQLLDALVAGEHPDLALAESLADLHRCFLRLPPLYREALYWTHCGYAVSTVSQRLWNNSRRTDQTRQYYRRALNDLVDLMNGRTPCS
jgi:hypothetical protein